MAARILLRGKIGHPDGEWLVGDALPQGHPGRIESDDPRRLLFKVWRAGGDSSKYVRRPTYKGWEPSRPAHDGRLEGVQVFTGEFACGTRRAVLSEYMKPGDTIEFGPDEYRCWFLPGGSFGAAGITICRSNIKKQKEFGEGLGYEYYPFIRPVAFPQWFVNYVPDMPVHCTLIVVFEGQIQDGENWQSGGMVLDSLEYMFLCGYIATAKFVITRPRTSFAILYF